MVWITYNLQEGGVKMTAKEALAIIEYYSTLNEIGQDEMQLDFDNALRFIKQALEELEELKEMFKLQSYHYVVEIKPTSYEKAKIYPEYQNEIKKYKELFYKLKGSEE